MNFDLRVHTHLLTIAGSRAYGIHTPSSDVDTKGVAIPPAAYFHGFARGFEQADKSSEIAVFADVLNAEERAVVAATKLEGSIYDLRKFMNLASDCNPNLLDALFCRDAEVRLCTPIGARLRAAREGFLSAKAKHTFSGYASAQLKRIKGHRAWLLDPPAAAPTRAEYKLPERTLLPADQLAAAESAVRKQLDGWELDLSGTESDAAIVAMQDRVARQLAEIRVALGFDSPEAAKWLAAARLVGLDDNLIEVLQRERMYEAAARHFRQYQEWKRSRNADRAALEAKHGYDTKHGAHLFRLLRMAREILTTGRVHVWRGAEDGGPGDVEEIRAIRSGAWTYDRLVQFAEAEDADLQRLYDTRTFVVPHAPDRDALDRLCMALVEEALGQVGG